MALHLLAAASAPGPAGEEFVRRIDELIARPGAHPILESLLLHRAEYFLAARNLEEASGTARSLLDRFPGSPLRMHALGVLTNAAWYGGRYLTAADYAKQTRDSTAEGPLRARLGVLVAEAWYRARNYRNAADAYAAALRSPPPDVAPGLLMFQRVQAEIDAGDNLEAAESLLNELSRDPAFDLERRWEAEWNLALALQAAGRHRPAYERCTRLLAAGAPASLPAPLRARMAWLQARLALDSGLPSEALSLANALFSSAPSLPAPLAPEIASLAGLIVAQAEFALGRQTDALASLARLRSSYPKTDAAVYSIITEADYYVSQERVADAQASLRALADAYSETPYAPYALYRAALLAEQRGQDSNFREANSLIEQLVERYPLSPLVFYARLRQGALLTRLNDFAPAEQTYEALVNQFPRHADILSARLALADCHSAQMGADPAHADRALELYEGLVAHPGASPDMRIEAGYKWGLSYSRRNEPQRAIEVWWRDVVGEFLAKPAQSARLGSTGRYWMARTLFELSELEARQGRTDESRRALQLIVDTAATAAYSELARARLAPPSSPVIKVPGT
jgi:tetratricopeptide (TPR) repeat protein